MSPIEFLRAVWPDSGLFCIASPFRPRGSAATVYRHAVFKTVEEAAAFCEKEAAQKDIFFCVHTLKEFRVWNEHKLNRKTGERGDWSVRTQGNMSHARTFFFDLDVGDGDGKYGSQREAMDALKAFVAQTKLPRPMVTSSGGGLHVYWRCADELPTPAWRVEAEKLKALAAAHGLKADPARTTDTASVLRVVGTFNLKHGGQRPVRIVVKGHETPTGEFIKLLDAAVVRADVSVKAPKVSSGSALDQLDAEDNTSKSFGEPPRAWALLQACPQMRHVCERKGNVDQTLWYYALGVMQHTQNGVENCHRMSAGHPHYSRAETDEKIAQIAPKSPVSCATLCAKSGNDLCNSCRFVNNAKVKNPVMAARWSDKADAPVVDAGVRIENEVAQPLVVEVPQPPDQYTRRRDGSIAMTFTNREGDEETLVILHCDLFPVRRMFNAQLEREEQLWRAVLPSEGERDFVVLSSALYDVRVLADRLASVSVFPEPGLIKEVQRYMISYIKELQRQTKAEAQFNHLGWTADHSEFILPDKVIGAAGHRPASLSTNARRASETIKKAGTLKRQIDLLRFYARPEYLPHQFLILNSLAAPIFDMTGHHGAIVCGYGETGASKSTAAYTGASFWGHPELFALNGTNQGATARARNERVTTLANLPIVVDEITNMAIKDAQDLAMGVSQPGHRLRLDQSGAERRSPDNIKSTILICTSNASLHGLLSQDNSAGTAGSMRVIEVTMRRVHVHTKIEADAYLRELKENYGHIGEEFIRYVLANYQAVRQRVIEVMAAIDAEARISGGERFWSGDMAAVQVAGEIANHLGLLAFDMRSLRAWMLNVQIKAMRNAVREEYATPARILTDFIASIGRETLIVENNPALKEGMVEYVKENIMGNIYARYERDMRRMFIIKKVFADYCRKIGANPTQALKELHAVGIVIDMEKRKRLASGTQWDAGQLSWCFTLDMTHPDIAGVVIEPGQPDRPRLRVVQGGRD